jgi:hypothetical protein
MKKVLSLVLTLSALVCLGQSKKEQIITLNNRVDSLKLALSEETQTKLRNGKRDALKIIDLNESNNKLLSEVKKKNIVNENLSQQNSSLQEKYNETLLKLETVVSVAVDSILKLQKKIGLLEQQILGNTNKVSDFKFNLIKSNTRESPAASVSFLADYEIQLLYGNSVIAVFEDVGEGWLSDEKDFVSIRTAAPSERSYTLISNNIGEVKITQEFFFGGMGKNVWTKTYKNYPNWKLTHCEGDCE